MTACTGLPRRGLGAVLGLAVVAFPAARAGDPGPDAGLIALCTEHAENARRSNASSADPDECPLYQEYQRTLDAITGMQAHTVGGMVAKARVAVLEATNPDGTVTLDHCIGSTWAYDIIHDLLRLEGGAA